jgi:hypothetical protein
MLAGFAEEILFRLKNDAVAPRDKRRAIEKEVFQRPIDDEQFATLNTFANQISDFVEDVEEAGAGGGGAGGEKLDEIGVSLVFEDEEEAGEGDEEGGPANYELRDDSDGEGEAALVPDDAMTDDTPLDVALAAGSALPGEARLNDSRLDPSHVDAHWLQRQVAKHVTEDAVEAKQLSEQIFATLESAADARVCENELLTLLQVYNYYFCCCYIYMKTFFSKLYKF